MLEWSDVLFYLIASVVVVVAIVITNEWSRERRGRAILKATQRPKR